MRQKIKIFRMGALRVTAHVCLAGFGRKRFPKEIERTIMRAAGDCTAEAAHRIARRLGRRAPERFMRVGPMNLLSATR